MNLTIIRHPGRVQARGGGRRVEEEMKVAIHYCLTAKAAKLRQHCLCVLCALCGYRLIDSSPPSI